MVVQGQMVFYFVRKVKGQYYLYKGYVDPFTKKKRQQVIGNCSSIEEIIKTVKQQQENRPRPAQGPSSSLVRTPPLRGGGPGFKSPRAHH